MTLNEAPKNGIDLAELERKNRLRYGVKKPADRWQHEMDDGRITSDQIRTVNYRGSMFDRDLDEQARVAGIPLRR